MSDAIELHDSEVAFQVVGDALVLHFRPAYVHHWERTPGGWRGEGREQRAEIVIGKGRLAPHLPEGIFEVSDGWLDIGSQRHDNMIPVPFQLAAPVRGWLELVNFDPVSLSGASIVVRLTGEPKRIEDLPDEWAPAEDAT